MKATQRTYLRAWMQEIEKGEDAGRLIRSNGRADLKAITSYAPETSPASALNELAEDSE